MFVYPFRSASCHGGRLLEDERRELNLDRSVSISLPCFYTLTLDHADTFGHMLTISSL